MIKKIKIWFLRKMLASKLLPSVLEHLEAEERDKRKEYLNRDVQGTEVDVDAGMRMAQVKIPVTFRRLHQGRKPELQLRVSDIACKRIQESNMHNFLEGKTIDVIFLIPDGVVQKKK